jgi:hypothetical protein
VTLCCIWLMLDGTLYIVVSDDSYPANG